MPQAASPAAVKGSDSFSTEADAEPEDEDILKELCSSNGINHANLSKDGVFYKKLEMFFSGFPRMVGLENFSNLQKLCIMGQSIVSINGLENVPSLTELWIAECALQSMSGLENCAHLTKLYLYSNKIRKIEHLTHMSELETLHLSSNSILQIEGLEGLINLKALHLAGNYIDKIGNTLSHLKNLQVLDLSGNRINSLWDLTRLGSLPALSDLSVRNALYSPCPVSTMCNFSTHVLYHLPRLQILDGCDVTTPAVKQLVETLINQKKAFYNMVLKEVEFDLSEKMRALDEHKQLMNEPILERLRYMNCIHNQVIKEKEEYEFEEGEKSDEGTAKRSPRSYSVHISKYQQKLAKVSQRITDLEKVISSTEELYKDAAGRAERIKRSAAHQLEVELETGGNISFEQGNPSLPWFNPVVDLVNSRFCKEQYKQHHISGIQVIRVTKVHHRLLEDKFLECLEVITSKDDVINANCDLSLTKKKRKQIEHLFWVWNPTLQGGLTAPTRVLEDGFLSAEKYRKLGGDAAITLSNSVAITDRFRISHCVKEAQKNFTNGRITSDPCPYRYGQMIVAKAFVGKTVRSRNEQKIERCNFTNVDSVVRLAVDMPDRESDLFQLCGTHVPKTVSGTKNLSNNSKQRSAWRNSNANNNEQSDDTVTDNNDESKSADQNSISTSDSVILETNNLAEICDDAIVKSLVTVDNEEIGDAVLLSEEENESVVSRIEDNGTDEIRHFNSDGSLVIRNSNINSNKNPLPSKPPISSEKKAANVFGGRWEWKGQSVASPAASNISTVSRKGSGKTSSKLSVSQLRNGDCSERHCEWFVFDNRLVLPAFIIDFKYITKDSSESPLQEVIDARQHTCRTVDKSVQASEKTSRSSISTIPNDDDIVTMLPHQKPLVCMDSIDDSDLLRLGRSSSLSNITNLNLNGCGLSGLPSLEPLVMLEKLIISFNELTHINLYSMKRLLHLDVMSNRLCQLDGIKNLVALRYLDISWNSFSSVTSLLAVLSKETPSLSQLDIRHNKFTKSNRAHVLALSRLPTLVYFNGSNIPTTERTEALRLAATGHVTQSILLRHSRLDKETPRSLTLLTVAQALEQVSEMKLSRVIYTTDPQWHNKITSLCIDNQYLTSLKGLEKLINLRWASFCNNELTTLTDLRHCTQLEELHITSNSIERLDGLERLRNLRRLSIGHNCISTLKGAGFNHLPYLSYLSVECNKLSNFTGLVELDDTSSQSKCSSLSELYAGSNEISNLHTIFILKSIATLEILTLSGNPIWRRADNNYRLFVVYHLTQIKALDGRNVTQGEMKSAIDMFGGKLTLDFVAEQLKKENFTDQLELSFPQYEFLTVNLDDGKLFENLLCVNLEKNNLTSFSGLINLPNLKVLCLNYNRIESILPRKRSPAVKSKIISKGPIAQNPVQVLSVSTDAPSANKLMEIETPFLTKLETLHLGYNGIKKMNGFGFERLSSLKALYLQGNEITKVECIGTLRDLAELVLDGNKIKNFSETSFIGQKSLRELHMDGNRLKSFLHIHYLTSLTHLYASNNKVEIYADLEELSLLPSLQEISLLSNPISRRELHRSHLIHNVKSIAVIDGRSVTEEERLKVEVLYMDQSQAVNSFISGVTALPLDPSPSPYNNSLNTKVQVPIKVTNIQLLAPIPTRDSSVSSKSGGFSNSVFPSLDSAALEAGKGAKNRNLVTAKTYNSTNTSSSSMVGGAKLGNSGSGGGVKTNVGRPFVNKRQYTDSKK